MSAAYVVSIFLIQKSTKYILISTHPCMGGLAACLFFIVIQRQAYVHEHIFWNEDNNYVYIYIY